MWDPGLFDQISLRGGIYDSKIRLFFGVGSIHISVQFLIGKGGYYFYKNIVYFVIVFKHYFSFCSFIYFGNFVNAAGP